jgi:DNA-binding NarL/FixJ family response regulator
MFMSEAVEALIAIGQLDRAEAVLETFEAQARRSSLRWAIATAVRCRALLLAARGDLAEAAAVADRALDHYRYIDAPEGCARTLLVRGAIQRRAGQRSRAKRSFEAALRTFEDLGATELADRARQETRRLGLARSSGDELTEGERRVAELAATGLTNQAVGAALFISAKTVEANLGRIYRKLGIGSRAELGARMAVVPQS